MSVFSLMAGSVLLLRQFEKSNCDSDSFVVDLAPQKRALQQRTGAALHDAGELLAIGRSADFEWTAMDADDWRQPFPGWPGTRYEQKAIREGRRGTYLTFRRR